MWYVVQVRTGTEESVQRQCEILLDNEIMKQCFIPRFEEEKRYRGEWHRKKEILFPGYVFIVSGDAVKLFAGLKNVNGLTKLLGIGNRIVPLSSEETNFLLKFGGKDQIVKLSKGIIENDKVIISEGPLKGYEGLICKIDRHKKKAWLEMKMFGKMQKIEVGLEILKKREIIKTIF